MRPYAGGHAWPWLLPPSSLNASVYVVQVQVAAGLVTKVGTRSTTRVRLPCKTTYGLRADPPSQPKGDLAASPAVIHLLDICVSSQGGVHTVNARSMSRIRTSRFPVSRAVHISGASGQILHTSYEAALTLSQCLSNRPMPRVSSTTDPIAVLLGPRGPYLGLPV
ncbi:hypothetical protein OH77DRAFT_842714 [Trametes cingulata]|nr:hypothetical protein OH77DRAFT_842714 [Trametes cingulata]